MGVIKIMGQNWALQEMVVQSPGGKSEEIEKLLQCGSTDGEMRNKRVGREQLAWILQI